MAQSPNTPTRRRRSSGFGSPLTTSPSQNGTPQRRAHSRKSSAQSIMSPTTPRPPSALDRSGSIDFGGSLAEQATADNGLGSLADELAEEEWDEDGEVESYTDGLGDGATEENQETHSQDAAIHNGTAATLSPIAALHERTNEPKTSRSRHRAKPSDYDGSDYGGSDDFDEVEGIPPSLESRLIDIENLARQGIGESKSPSLDVISHVAERLKDLGSQVSVETHMTRLSTAHTALTTHMAHQSRLLSSLTHPLTNPLATPPDVDTVDELIPLLETLFLSLPHPPTSPLPSVHAFHTNTDDLLATLSTLADSLHMIRTTSNKASRNLRSARETTATLKREYEEAEEGRRWLEKGGWDSKLEQKHAASVCREVVGGFEEVCESWRQRLTDSERNGIEVMAG